MLRLFISIFTVMWLLGAAAGYLLTVHDAVSGFQWAVVIAPTTVLLFGMIVFARRLHG